MLPPPALPLHTPVRSLTRSKRGTLTPDETERWKQRLVERDPAALAILTAGKVSVKSASYAISTCIEQRNWEWLDQLWPPRPQVLNQGSFVNEWVLDVLATGASRRAMDLYHRADVTQNLGHLLSVAVGRADPLLWQRVVSLKEWCPEQGEQAAIALVKWCSQSPHRGRLARAWFLRLATALPAAHNQARLVRVALLTKGMEGATKTLFRTLPLENQRQVALEIYPLVEAAHWRAWVRRCWKALEARGTHESADPDRLFSVDFFREWFRDTTPDAQHRLLPCLDSRELYTAWQAAHLELKEALSEAIWRHLVARPTSHAHPARFLALSTALKDGDMVWASRWWSEDLGATLDGAQHFQLAILSHGVVFPPMKAWICERLNWDKLEQCVRHLDRPCEGSESAALDEALLRAPADTCAKWVQQFHGAPANLPLATLRVLAQDREAISKQEIPARSCPRRYRS